MSESEEVVALVDRIKPLLAGHPPDVQGGALADLVAIHLAGHVIAGDPAGTDDLRGKLLHLHVAIVRRLIEPNAKMIGTDQ